MLDIQALVFRGRGLDVVALEHALNGRTSDGQPQVVLQEREPRDGLQRGPTPGRGLRSDLGPITRPRRSRCSQSRGVTRIGEGDHFGGAHAG
jgi:hypothetical protein